MLRSVSRKMSACFDETDDLELNMSLNESLNLDELSKQRALSLRILDGNIELSCRSGRATPVFMEENEMDSYLDENSDEHILTSESVESGRIDSLSISSGTEFDGRDSESTDSNGDSKSLVSQDEGLGVPTHTQGSGHSEIVSDKSNVKGSPTTTARTDVTSEAVDASKSETSAHLESSSVRAKVLLKQDSIDRKALEKNEIDEREGNELAKEPGNEPEKNTGAQVGVAGLPNKEKQMSAKMKKTASGASLKSYHVETQANNRVITRTDSLESSRLLSENEVETDDNYLQRYFETEIGRMCERLEGEPPSQNIIKCLVSLTTPRDLLSVAACEQPAFVEFDMSADGFGCLFIGSIAPMGSQGKSRSCLGFSNPLPF